MRISTCLLIALFATLPLAAGAHPGGQQQGRDHLDARHGLNHAYLEPGARLQAVPPTAVAVPHGQQRYWFHDGTWYRHERGGYLVVAPPVGVVVPMLPVAYVTLSIGGVPTYYANEAYYQYVPELNGYQVVAPPADADVAEVAPPAMVSQTPALGTDELYVYPRNGQTPDQQAADRYDCHRWAFAQTGFDPTLPAGGVDADQAGAKRADYARATSACLEGRGYTVR